MEPYFVLLMMKIMNGYQKSYGIYIIIKVVSMLSELKIGIPFICIERLLKNTLLVEPGKQI